MKPEPKPLMPVGPLHPKPHAVNPKAHKPQTPKPDLDPPIKPELPTIEDHKGSLGRTWGVLGNRNPKP